MRIITTITRMAMRHAHDDHHGHDAHANQPMAQRPRINRHG